MRLLVMGLSTLSQAVTKQFPRNISGRWCKELSTWTRHLVEAFMGQIGRQV
jgi:hypothetical protein